MHESVVTPLGYKAREQWICEAQGLGLRRCPDIPTNCGNPVHRQLAGQVPPALCLKVLWLHYTSTLPSTPSYPIIIPYIGGGGGTHHRLGARGGGYLFRVLYCQLQLSNNPSGGGNSHSLFYCHRPPIDFYSVIRSPATSFSVCQTQEEADGGSTWTDVQLLHTNLSLNLPVCWISFYVCVPAALRPNSPWRKGLQCTKPSFQSCCHLDN